MRHARPMSEARRERTTREFAANLLRFGAAAVIAVVLWLYLVTLIAVAGPTPA